MLSPHLKFLRSKDTIKIRVNLPFRVVNALIFIFLTGTSLMEGELTGFIFTIMLLTLGALLYREVWIFDAQNQSFYHFFGIAMVGKKIRGQWDDIEALDLSSAVFHKVGKENKTGWNQKGMVTLSLVSLTNGNLDIEKFPLNKKKELEEWGNKLSAFLNKPLYKENS